MNHRQRFDQFKRLGILHIGYDQRLEALTNELIGYLYKPFKDVKGMQTSIVDVDRLKAFNIDDSEPINWGDLSATCKLDNGVYHIIIEEAGPAGCSSLCDYITSHLMAWGYDGFMVSTEW